MTHKKLFEESKTSLDEPVTSDELNTALNDMQDCKSPGIDGLSNELYATFWLKNYKLSLTRSTRLYT